MSRVSVVPSPRVEEIGRAGQGYVLSLPARTRDRGILAQIPTLLCSSRQAMGSG